MLSWFQENSAVLLTLLGILSVVTFVGSLVALPLLVARLPADYFVRPQQVTLPWRTARPVRNSILCVLRNLLGFLLVLGGLAMLFLPGQGVLTIAVASSLRSIPPLLSASNESKIACIFRSTLGARYRAGGFVCERVNGKRAWS